MLTARNVIVATIVVTILSVIGGVFSLVWHDPGRNTFGRDTYGTRADGQRAAYELLKELGFSVERTLIPEAVEGCEEANYVLWNPLDSLVQVEPAHLQVLAKWVREGGRLVVASTPEVVSSEVCRRCSQAPCTECIPVSLLKEIGLERVNIRELPISNETEQEFSEKDLEDRDFDDFRRSVKKAFEKEERPTHSYPIVCEGEFDQFASAVKNLLLPAGEAWAVEYEDEEPEGVIRIADSQDEPYAIAAEFSVGRGRIVVVSNPYLASNRYLGSADNSVLLTCLLTGERPRVIFDEFYHGLTMRGNALWLLSQRPYAVMAIFILTVVGFWIWRQSTFLGPSRRDEKVMRRSLSEYIEAMSLFLLQGRESPKYVLRELKDGVIWSYSNSLGLPPQQHDEETVISLLARRQPKKAQQLQAALASANNVLNSNHIRKDAILQAIQKVSDCLSKTHTERFDKK